MKQSKQKRYKELMIGLMSGTIVYLHGAGFSDANSENLFTEPIYATMLDHQLSKVRSKAKDPDIFIVCDYLISLITCEYGNVESNPLDAVYAKNRDIIGPNPNISEPNKHEWWNV